MSRVHRTRAVRQGKEAKGIHIGKEEIKLFVFIILYIENPKESTKEVLELINEFSKFAGYKKIYQNQLYSIYLQ